MNSQCNSDATDIQSLVFHFPWCQEAKCTEFTQSLPNQKPWGPIRDKNTQISWVSKRYEFKANEKCEWKHGSLKSRHHIFIDTYSYQDVKFLKGRLNLFLSTLLKADNLHHPGLVLKVFQKSELQQEIDITVPYCIYSLWCQSYWLKLLEWPIAIVLLLINTYD